MQVLNVLSTLGFSELYNLEGGMIAFADRVDPAAYR